MKLEKIHLKDYFNFLGENGKDPTVYLYLQSNPESTHHQNTKRPSLIICPGGGYQYCWLDGEGDPLAFHFLPEGFNVFVLDYSVEPNCFPTQLIEVAALMELIYKNADEWHCNTEKIAIMGFSAGGHLAAHYSTMFDCEEVRAVFPESKSVNASVLGYPVITADPKYAHWGSMERLTGKYPDNQYLDRYSCEKCVKENTPPAFIWHIAEDSSVSSVNSLLYAKALIEHKIPTELHIYPFGWHGTSTCDEHVLKNTTEGVAHAAAWLDDVKKWFKLIDFKIERQ